MILITGGLGLLGSRIALRLLEEGHKVRLSTRKANPENVPKELKDCHIFETELSDVENLKIACAGITHIIHLAGVNASNSKSEPTDALSINGLGTYNLLEAAKREQVKHFIYFSTAHVYGSPLKGSLNELSPTYPMHHYSITHRLAEDYVALASNESEIKTTVFRLSNAVGAPVSMKADCWMLVVNDLVKQCVTEGKMIFRSKRYEKRDFISINDVCDAVIYDFVRSRNSSHELFNLGNGKVISLEELSQLIFNSCKRILGFEPKIVFPEEKTHESNENNLDYSNHKLISKGFRISGNLEVEIDNLFLKSKEWFLDD